MSTPNNDHVKAPSAVSNLTFYTVTATGLNLSNTSVDADGKNVLDKLVEGLSINAQPVVLTVTSNTVAKVGTEHVLPAATMQAGVRSVLGAYDFSNTTVTLGM